MVEQHPFKVKVGGSTPPALTKKASFIPKRGFLILNRLILRCFTRQQMLLCHKRQNDLQFFASHFEMALEDFENYKKYPVLHTFV